MLFIPLLYMVITVVVDCQLYVHNHISLQLLSTYREPVRSRIFKYPIFNVVFCIFLLFFLFFLWFFFNLFWWETHTQKVEGSGTMYRCGNGGTKAGNTTTNKQTNNNNFLQERKGIHTRTQSHRHGKTGREWIFF